MSEETPAQTATPDQSTQNESSRLSKIAGWIGFILLFVIVRGCFVTAKSDGFSKAISEAMSGSEVRIDAEGIAGSWYTKKGLNSEEFVLLAGDLGELKFKSGVVEADYSYRSDGTYNVRLKSTFVHLSNDVPVEIALQVEQSGTWRLEGRVVTEVVSNGAVSPLNDTARMLLENDPTFMSEVVSPGASSTSTVERLSERMMTQTDSGVRFVFFRRG